MASSSSSHVPPVKYDVFISFRGTDIRHGFLSHLRKELRQKQVDAYVDDRLEGGDEISKALVKAIEGSLMSLIIFSKDYASSKWCLEELVKIVECMARNKQVVIPVFYNVNPTDVRHQKGTYGDSLAKHEKNKGSLAKVRNWGSALTIAANLSGFHSSKYGDEVELIEEIVKCLSSKLNLMYQSELTDLVGIEERIADLESLLCLDSTADVLVIGIWGMGGIGKTTLAAAVYNRLCFEYEGSCFMANITEESEKHGMIYLKNKILSILLKENDLHIGTPIGVPPYVKRRLARKKVLLVLDDINDLEHLENLVGGLDWFGSGSRIIVTTRDKQVLGKRVNCTYEAKALQSDDAIKLFIMNAFEHGCLDMEWIELSRRVIHYANGNPLALKVLGSFLYGKSKIEWESQLQKLKKMPHAKIQNVLRLSYDRLDREEKNIFLYIACLLKGYEVQQIIALLDACGFSTIIGLRVLKDKALIIEAKGSGRSIVSMHDLIQEMGWEIVREECVEDPGKRSRLWDPNDVHQVLTNNTGTKAIKSITLNVSKFDELHLSPQVFGRMQQLKFLKFTQHYGDEKILYLPQGLESLPNDLLLFQWVSYPLKSLPQSFCAENLVELKLTWSRVEKLWDGIQNIQHLKKIDLSYSKYLLDLPDFSKASNLEEIELFGCKSLLNVHPSILRLNKLVRLNLFYCKALTSLRSDTHLRSLRDLFLSGCSRLEDFSVTSDNMKDLALSSTAINELPSSIGSLKNLETLTLDFCKSLNKLPNEVIDLRSLRALYVHGCTQLDASNLHILLSGLASLETLKLEECRNLSEIPDNISLLSSLRELLLKETDIERFPASIKHLSKLEKLDVKGCRRLQNMPELPPSLKELYATDCSSLETVMFNWNASDLLQLQAYKLHTQFQNCVNLDELSLRAIEVNAQVNMKKLAYNHLSTLGSKFLDGPVDVIYPGSKVPEWLMYRTTEASVTVDFSSAPKSKFVGFIFCVVAGQLPSDDKNFIGCDCYLETGNGEKVSLGSMDTWTSIHSSEFFSDHIFMWYDELCCLQNSKPEKENMDELMASYIPKVSFEFFAQSGNTWKKRENNMIRGCGVCPIYDTEYFDFIKQMELELEMTLQSIANERSAQCNDKKEKLGPKQPCKKFFPPFQTGIWKSATQGLKDILFL
ncbi:disease resistance-like protein DSC1 isoform X1 [Medicago truncatula]|uniref:ADP-ribosyl cyclase/cyclic ADP-ribose hydrolase n=4 Tax=Medicago truncatula TaxID=3880 RepID=G7IUH0_MEDTR|nr:disease resistance-like protein DSC1 isoform X1 [Medicago truncatula]AES67842.2 disease resistance protein (TIR-NBS-LRR class), putative [Medicago truncatula]